MVRPMDSGGACCIAGIIVRATVAVAAEEQYVHPLLRPNQAGRLDEWSIRVVAIKDSLFTAY